MKISKIKAASVISALTGLLVYPRPSAARLGMPAPIQKSQQNSLEARTSQKSTTFAQPMVIAPQLDLNAVFKTPEQLNSFLQSPAMQDRSKATMEDVLNYLIEQVEQLQQQQQQD